MKKPYIKNPIPEAISEDGGASVMFVNKQTVPLDGAIREALEGNYCTGQATLIRNFFFGLMQSMADGVRRDGHARQIANFLTVYPVFKGEVDLDRGYDPEKNSVMIRARLLNEMDLDISDWSFEDVTPGKRAFSLTSCTTGEVTGEYRVGELGHINGKPLPSTLAGEELRVHWEVEGTDRSGNIPTAKLFSEIDRIDIAADALDELKQPEYDGKTIVFTVRGNYSSAKIPATIRYVEPPPVVPTMTDLHAERHPEMPWTVMCDQAQVLTGTNLKDATVKLTCGDYEETLAEDMFVSQEDTKLVFHVNGTMYEHGETGKIVVTLNGQSAEHDIEVIAGD